MLQFVGRQQVFPRSESKGLTEGQLTFYEGFFRRLRPMSPRSLPIRIVRFTETLSPAEDRVFIGVDTTALGDPQAPESYPPSASAAVIWRLWRHEREIVTVEGGCTTVDRHPLGWRWLVNGPAAPIGEFDCQLAGEPTEVRVTAQAFLDPGREVTDGDRVAIVDYDEAWPAQYRGLQQELESSVGTDVLLRCEHWGSTAVPGLAAKPVVDLLVEIPDVTLAKRRLLETLTGPEWEYWWSNDHLLWIRRDGFMGRRTHHVHLVPTGHPYWRQLAFRDHLRAHPAVARRYAALKRELSAQYATDRERYTLAKGQWIERVMAELSASRAPGAAPLADP